MANFGFALNTQDTFVDLNALPISAVERIEANARQSREAIERPGEVVNGDVLVQDLARLRQETRRELAAVLNPQQLEEYLLRYSQSGDQLREQLRGFGADADEFRRIFRIRDSYDQQIAALSTNDTASAAMTGPRFRRTYFRRRYTLL